MNRKRFLVLLFVIVVVAAYSARVYAVNKGVAKEYSIESFAVGDEISLGNAVLTVEDVRYGEETEEKYDQEWIQCTVTMGLENTSEEAISKAKVIETKLAYGRDVYQTNQGNFDINALLNIEPGKQEKIELTYEVKAEDQQGQGKLYIVQDLYPELVEKVYKQGKRYGIAVDL
ncbi:DUF4352 domain-containing protein [Sediminibacillus albus]|uniref:Uncharacterized protein n=1 Tax=Sediminibacillus albus TaxID=407036 RepID=A0A1G8WUW3_9BACI|nr:DUF4352 domain-containing protein [Sediminibacillus albus]SDJ81836.1 protein of unknown function [Sediminibacillus albus]